MTKSRKTGMTVIFCIYCALSLYFFLAFSRTVSDNPLWARLYFNANVVPLKTIFEYTAALFNHGIDFADIVLYIVGNAALAIPLGLFLPCLFKRMRSVCATLLTTASAMFVLEFFQFLLRLGSFDIDSVILRTLGAAVGYVVYRRLMAFRDEHVSK